MSKLAEKFLRRSKKFSNQLQKGQQNISVLKGLSTSAWDGVRHSEWKFFILVLWWREKIQCNCLYLEISAQWIWPCIQCNGCIFPVRHETSWQPWAQSDHYSWLAPVWKISVNYAGHPLTLALMLQTQHITTKVRSMAVLSLCSRISTELIESALQNILFAFWIPGRFCWPFLKLFQFCWPFFRLFGHSVAKFNFSYGAGCSKSFVLRVWDVGKIKMPTFLNKNW